MSCQLMCYDRQMGCWVEFRALQLSQTSERARAP